MMRLSEEQAEELEKIVRPVMAFLNNNGHPHTRVVISTVNAELSEGVWAIYTADYVKG